MNTNPDIEPGDIVITTQPYNTTSPPVVIEIVDYTDGLFVYNTWNKFDRKKVERLNPDIRWHDGIWQHTHKKDNRNYWHPMMRQHSESLNEKSNLNECLVIGDWVITKPHHCVKIQAGKITAISDFYVGINNDTCIPKPYLIRINPDIRFHEGEYEHRHNDINWHGMSRIHKDHAFLHKDDESKTKKVEIIFKRIVEKGEPMWELVSFSGIKSENDLPTKYAEAQHELFWHSSRTTSGIYVYTTDFDTVINIGDKLSQKDIAEFAKIVGKGAEHLRKINKEIKELKRTHCGEYIIEV